MYEAARINDHLHHTSALAGFIAGAIVGALVIGAAAFFVATTLATGGAACFVAGLLVGIAADIVGHAALSLGEQIGSMFTHDVGQINTGSPDVFVNSRQAARVELSTTGCSDHSSSPVMAQGSTNIFINSKAAVRKDDHTTCDATVSSGAKNVFFGGGTATYLKIEKEIPDEYRKYAEWLFMAAGFLGGAAAVLRNGGKLLSNCMAKFVVGELVGFGIGKTIEAGLGYVFNPVDVIDGQKILTGDDDIDFVIGDLLPIELVRSYNSADRRQSCLGQGWSLSWHKTLRREGEQIIYCDDDGTETLFPLPKRQEKSYSSTTQVWLGRTEDDNFIISSPFEYCYIFGQLVDQQTIPLQRIIDRHLHQIVFHYNDEQQLTMIKGSGGYQLECRYQDNRLVSIHSTGEGYKGTLVSYGYDENRQLIEVKNQLGQITRRFCYQQGVMTEHSNQQGLVCCYQWQKIGDTLRVISHYTNCGERWQFSYDTEKQTTTVTDLSPGETNGRMAVWHYNDKQRITRYQDFDGLVYQYGYDANNMPDSWLLPDKSEIKVGYDSLSRPVMVRDAMGFVTTTVYHNNSLRPLRKEFPDGRYQKASYDDVGRILSEQSSGKPAIHYQYDNNHSQPVKIINALGGENALSWDNHERLIAYQDCSGYQTTYDYDLNGFLSKVTEANGDTTFYRYNSIGQLLAVRYPDNGQDIYQYNDAGLLSLQRNRAGVIYEWQYNQRGQLIRHHDGLKRNTHYNYDCYGRLTRLNNANGGSYTFNWDNADRLVTEKRPDNTARHFVYNNAGGLTQIITQAINKTGETVSKSLLLDYDKNQRLLAKTSDDTQTVYAYDEMARLLGVEVIPTTNGKQKGIPASKLTFSYDKAGRLCQETQVNGEINYQWDALDNLVELTLPNQQTINWLRYGSGHVSAMSFAGQLVSEFSRDKLHREVIRTQGRLSQFRQYDVLGRRISQSSHFTQDEHLPEIHTGKLWRLYQYSPADNISHIEDNSRGNQDFYYDAESRLTGSRTRLYGGMTLQRFDYDKADNLLDEHSTTPITDNRLTLWQQLNNRYDEWGNLIERKTFDSHQHFDYDTENRLIKAYGKGPQGQHVTHYYYDGLGRRTSKQVTRQDSFSSRTETTTFLWQGLRLLQEHSPACFYSYLYEPNDDYTPLARINHNSTSNSIEYYHSEVNGQPLELTDSEGTILWSATYNSWGKLLRLNQINDREGRVFGIDQPLRYAGQYADNETGLHYNTFRYYDPEIGRFTQQDPIGLEGGINLYQYAPNPLTYTDPLGWWTVKIGGYVIRVHANDIDPWPSIPHGHIYDKNLVIDKHGNIFKAHNGPLVDSLSKKDTKIWKQELKNHGC